MDASEPGAAPPRPLPPGSRSIHMSQQGESASTARRVRRPSGSVARDRRGLTLVEVTMALPIVLLGLGLFVQMLTAGARLRDVGREEVVAIAAAQVVLERMHNEPFRDLFRLHDPDPFDDPGGPGTAPGDRFDVEGLALAADRVGTIELPIWNMGTVVVPLWELREDLAQAELGMPRDLNCDALLDDRDHSADYTILPVVVRVRWDGRHGQRQVALQTILAEVR